MRTDCLPCEQLSKFFVPFRTLDHVRQDHDDTFERSAGKNVPRRFWIARHAVKFHVKHAGPAVNNDSCWAVTITVDSARHVSGLLQVPPEARSCYVLAHGAGAGMTHPFLTAVAHGLAGRGIATLRYQFPYMEQGSKRPDASGLAQLTVRAAVEAASRLVPGLVLVAGGKSFGGRMTSQAQAESPLPGVRGLAFLGFPLHPPGRPSKERAKHLFAVRIPMLFLQGTRDEFANLELLKPQINRLGARATLILFGDANHSFHVPARTGRKDSEIMAEMLDALANWIETTVGKSRHQSAKHPQIR